MSKTRETWLNGWHRSGDTVFVGGAICCAGCGKESGVTCWSVQEGATLPDKSPDWPFDLGSCPMCSLRDRILEAPQDKLTQRLQALKAR